MNDKIKEFFNEIDKYINSVVYNPELMKKSIKFMYRYPNYEWYNIAAILIQNPNAELVMSVTSFREKGNDISLTPRIGKKAYRIASLNIENGNLEFKLKPVFDVTDLNKKVMINNVIPLRMTVEQYGGSINILAIINKYTSIEKIVLSIVDNNYEGFISKDDLTENRVSIKNCVMFSLGRIFNVDPNINITLNKTNNAVGIYSYIKHLINMFPQELINIIEVLKARAIEEERMKKLELIYSRNIKQRVIDAKTKVINEFGDNEVIPPPEDDSLIYEGDYDL